MSKLEQIVPFALAASAASLMIGHGVLEVLDIFDGGEYFSTWAVVPFVLLIAGWLVLLTVLSNLE